jgi:predicted metal-dependent phosphoesterase TrpH
MKCDLHCHTSYSYDSTASPEEMVEAALRKGINCLAICDHGEIKGAQKAIEYAKDRPILIIPGIEIKSKEGDILGLNVKEIIPNKLSAEETIKKIKESGGLAIIPHPFGWSCSFKGDLKNLSSKISGVEVLNASIFGSGNKIALDFAKKHNLPLTAGSDAHFPNFVGRCYLEIPGENLSMEEILNQIKKGVVKIGGKEANFFEKVIDHLKRNFSKIFKVLS